MIEIVSTGSSGVLDCLRWIALSCFVLQAYMTVLNKETSK